MPNYDPVAMLLDICQEIKARQANINESILRLEHTLRLTVLYSHAGIGPPSDVGSVRRELASQRQLMQTRADQLAALNELIERLRQDPDYLQAVTREIENFV